MLANNRIEKVLISEEMIQTRVRVLGALISKDYAGLDLVFVSILKGGVYFLTDLTRNMTIPHVIDFMVVSSYGDSQETSGIVRMVKDLKEDIRNRHVIVVEDIIDTGLTIDYLLKYLQSRTPASLEVCSFLSKPSRRRIDVPIKYLGYEIEDKYAVGYGLDYKQQYRHLPFICAFQPE
ncbi:hypoxanthine phosphoribosyltransferase [candidate division KSB3 bacterium]|uniref:Hypoxanthine phosphoribosyltransferase n=1 Tax=candidate division KSB3 bacterium TaxID=2044937 RepID=A0A2G6EAE0_9BACT|nr:MAG: hypoxanthine phosphoribosyltransferase [candidate division KSB3 bacterium]PIE30988.1 MAG: hypoxanthine phosphoribosyltransferase [candidate division KSB3 bacterium]